MASAYLSTRLYHQCDTGSIPGNGAGAFIKLCVGSILGHKDFFPGPLVFLLQKESNTFSISGCAPWVWG